jgi:hypothetical protein
LPVLIPLFPLSGCVDAGRHPAMIRRLQVRGYRALRAVDVELRDFQVLVGPRSCVAMRHSASHRVPATPRISRGYAGA